MQIVFTENIWQRFAVRAEHRRENINKFSQFIFGDFRFNQTIGLAKFSANFQRDGLGLSEI